MGSRIITSKYSRRQKPALADLKRYAPMLWEACLVEKENLRWGENPIKILLCI